MFSIKTEYYLQLLMPETMILLGSTKSKITEDKNNIFKNLYFRIFIWFTDRNSKSLEIEDKINITLVIN